MVKNSITHRHSNQQILAMLGERLRAARLSANMTQHQLAEQAGVSESMVRLAEHGTKSIGLLNLIALLRALGLLEQLNALLPVPAPRPEAFVRQAGDRKARARQRARPRPKGNNTQAPWQWEDEAQ